ncbi:hypothetical protein [Idiomarina abyssalis]|uniref:hypothetical protein n=1 Tax=Idiomarina abyssalis TaxID=86102 RepID=UPI003A933F63
MTYYYIFINLFLGFTQAIGGSHAEVEALNAHSGDLSGVTAYVTLEPCSFVGRTAACASTLLASGIKHVVIARISEIMVKALKY